MFRAIKTRTLRTNPLWIYSWSKKKINRFSKKNLFSYSCQESRLASPSLARHQGIEIKSYLISPVETDNNSELEPKLNEEQNLVCKLVLEGKSIFLTGSAGTGKSFLLKKIIADLQAKYGGEQIGITSTTGTGAIIIGGATLHSYLGIGIASNSDKSFLLRRILANSKARNHWTKIKVLIIDEISMLEGNLFEKLESIARRIRNNNQPFGGIQLVLVGDFCQLPPASRREGDNSLYCFETPAWGQCISQTIELKQIYRQKSNWFITYLQAIRFGRLSKKRWEEMLNRLGREPDWPADGIKPISLFSTNHEVGSINEQELNKLPTTSHFFLAEDKEIIAGKLKELTKSCLTLSRLELKVGAQVMLIKNWHEEKLVNGSQGVVTRFVNFQGKKILPVVKFTNGKELVIEEETWHKIEGYNFKNRPIISAWRKQIPLILAWAVTINKSQGQSLKRLKIDLNKCFMAGQVYTALSRATDPNYLQIVNFSYARLWCDQKVRDFYSSLTEGTPSLPSHSERETNWHRLYLENKIRSQWKEILEIYESSQKWPYLEIEKLLGQQNQEYFSLFLKIIEKSISNSSNLVSYRELIDYLQKWWGQARVKRKEIF
ncbi:MAG: AAA family ATPase [Candidatus Moeniiplasma glomeromycotorum]|nr:AAA family ATPase [Candidatus Moeniiplasma glomeromycotorum]MCE8167357.1 AAA family ATPase [Candidatus Moeniiplasma glomeromycotorum]MCE8168630.1 AAA family ATPase [Candidatus Moeniiplasma glomeromycotorum]